VPGTVGENSNSGVKKPFYTNGQKKRINISILLANQLKT
jgi:hypothetical protein